MTHAAFEPMVVLISTTSGDMPCSVALLLVPVISPAVDI